MVSHLKGYLTGRLLASMPHMQDSRFYKSLIFICSHDEKGAMGLVINQHVENLTMQDLLLQMGLSFNSAWASCPVYAGGPVEGGRGFVLHTPDYENANTLLIKNRFALTSTVDILSTIGQGEGPRKLILALGYAGWGAGQLDAEIQSNGWLHLEADEELVFNTAPLQKWHKAIERLGVQELMLSPELGHA